MSIIIVVILAAVGALFFLTGGKTSASVLVVDANIVAKDKAKYSDRELRIRGFVKPGSVLRYGDKADFTIALEGSEIPVHFNGNTQLPDTFADNAPVRADGVLDESGKLVATKVEAKCASKYDADYAKKGGSGNHPAGVAQGSP
ncbi:MAG: cytochrome c maturation protein CcmE [Spirochaetia bacterium]|nr:cytochrome c maturation protein CcmE [Spirochaetia bacterium]